MDESSFDFDQATVASASAGFPAQRRAAGQAEEVPADLDRLGTPGSFGEHVWDENGHY
ncbi:MAG: hypothetical protein QM597_04635 [Aeromicrobium sp.]|uniref:hypothetical protein n=1 Tax=Aeromicrobium sp. TaxID=1871063 RepID=UPI0039E522ED